jgi:hypothetical protein
LLSGPLDNIKKAFACSAGHSVKEAWRLPQPALVGAYNDIIVLCPETGIRCLPC